MYLHWQYLNHYLEWVLNSASGARGRSYKPYKEEWVGVGVAFGSIQGLNCEQLRNRECVTDFEDLNKKNM